MLDPWIIEEIVRREEEERRGEERRRRVIPLEPPHYREREPAKPSDLEDESNRGVIVIDI